MQRLLVKELSKCESFACKIFRKSKSSSHQTRCNASVPYSSNIKKRGNFFNTVSFITNKLSNRSLQVEFCRRQGSCSHFVLQFMNQDIVKGSIVFSSVNVKET